MILSLHTYNRQGHEQHFTCVCDSLEASLDAVSILVENGNQLRNVELIEAESRLALPVEAFDGQPFSAALHQLRAQYQAILVRPATFHEMFIALRLQRIDRHERMIHRLEQAVTQAQQRLARVQQSLPGKPHLEPTLEQLQRTLARYEANLLAEQASLMDVAYRL